MSRISACAKIQQALLSLSTSCPNRPITICAVCQAAGVHRSTFYAHYNCLNDVIDEIEKGFVEQMPLMDCRQSEAYLLKRTELYIQYLEQHKEAFLLLMESRRITAPILEVSSEKTSLFFQNSDQHLNHLLSVYASIGMLSVCYEWLKSNINISREALAQMLVSLEQRIIAVL